MLILLLGIYVGIGLMMATALVIFDPHTRTGNKVLSFVLAALLWPFIVLIWLMGLVGGVK